MPFTSNRLLRYLAQQAALIALTALVTRIGWLFVGAETGVSWLWPQAGLGLAALTLLGVGAWPALLIGGTIGHQWAIGVGSTPVVLLAALDTVEPLFGALLLRHWLGFRVELFRVARRLRPRRRDCVRRRARRARRHQPHRRQHRGSPLLRPRVQHVARRTRDGRARRCAAAPVAGRAIAPRSPPTPARLVEIGGLCLALASAGMVAYFASVRGDVHSPLEYLPFPVAIWAAMRFGVRGATAASLLISGVALAGHLLLEPPGTAAPSEGEMLLIQASLAVGALTALLVGAVTTERDETMRALGESEQRATALFAQAPDAIFILDGERPHVGAPDRRQSCRRRISTACTPRSSRAAISSTSTP